MEQPRPATGPSDRTIIGALTVCLTLGVLVWSWGGIAGLLFGAGWPSLYVGEVAHVLLATPTHLADPRLAWPPAARPGLPGPFGFYSALPVVLLVAGGSAAAVAAVHRRQTPGGASADKGGARWAKPSDLTGLSARRRVNGQDDGGTRLGLGFSGRRLLRAEQRHALVLFGPPQSGKSAGLAVGALLEWKGPAIASSIKTDLLQATVARRRQLGRVFVFDPFGLSGQPTSTWSPEHDAETFDDALEIAHRLTSAGELDQRSVEGGDFWSVAAEQRLAPLLYLACRTGKGISALVRWAYGRGEHELDQALENLTRSARSSGERRDAHAAFDAIAAFRAQPDRTRGSIEGTTQALLRAYRSHRVQQSATTCEITPEALLDGENTLYLVGDAKASRLLRPIFLGLLGELIDHAYQQANRNGGRLATPLLLCLDELGNVAPLPNLAEVASTAPSHNIQLVSVFHDLAQAHTRYGRQAETVINSHRARMLLPGVADLDTLRYFSGLVGDQHAREQTRTSGPGYETRSENPTRRPLIAPEQLRQLPDGHGLLVYGRLPPTTVRLRMWFKDHHLRELAQNP
jgi:type IV secretion system protein VirD4